MAAAAPANVCKPPVLYDDRLFLVTNEEGQKVLQQRFAKASAEQQLPKKAACGVSGLFILNIASLDPAIERIDFYDVNERVKTFWKAFSTIIKSESNRQTALARVQKLMVDRSNEFFSKDHVRIAIAANISLEQEVKEGLSFLSSDERYARIKKIFDAKCISVQVIDLFQKDCLAKFWEVYQAQGYSPSLVYWSNVLSTVPSMEAYRNFQHNVSVIPAGAIYIDASRIERSQPGQNLPDYFLRMAISPNFPKQLPDQFLFDGVFKTDDLTALQTLDEEKVPMDWFLPDDTGSPLMLAAFSNSVKCMRFLMEQKGASAKAISPKIQQSPLHATGGPEAAEMLLAAGADINAVDAKNRTPVYCAAARDKPQVLQYLLSRGAFPSMPDDKGFTALCRAIEKESVVCVRLLLDAENIDPQDIKKAFAFAKGAVLSTIVEHPKVKKLGLDVNSRDETGATLLLTAAHYGRVDDVRWLLQHGADPKLKLQGLSPLAVAQQLGHKQVSAILQKPASRS